MFRKILAIIGIVEILAPREFIDAAERLALDNPDECELKSWVVPVARGEGLLFLFLARRDGSSYSGFKTFLGVIGLLAILSPKLFVDYSAELAYVGAERCEWKSWVYPLTRLFGVTYVLLALEECRKR